MALIIVCADSRRANDSCGRAQRVQLAATLRTRPDFTPLSFKARGKSYRFVNVDYHNRDGEHQFVMPA